MLNWKNKIIWLPYFIAILISCLFFWLSYKNAGTLLGDLFINLSASFIAIPLVLIFVDVLRDRIDKNLKIELFDYAKKNIDNDILSAISHINKLFNIPTLPINSPLFKSITVLLNLEDKVTKETVTSISPLGFQIFKDWGETNKYFSDALQNPLALKVFNTKQLTTLIQLLKAIQIFEKDLKDGDNFKFVANNSEKFKVAKGTDINFRNVILPNRWILLEKTKKADEHIVRDFGDFDQYFEDKLLNKYEITESGKVEITEDVIQILHLTNQWLSLTGNEFIFDSKRFRGAVIEKSPKN